MRFVEEKIKLINRNIRKFVNKNIFSWCHTFILKFEELTIFAYELKFQQKIIVCLSQFLTTYKIIVTNNEI